MMKNKMIDRTLENDIIFPALLIISEHGAVSTSKLADTLEKLYRPTGEDAQILKNRSDRKIRQIVRNLVSHRKLDKMGLAKYVNGNLYITHLGRIHVENTLKSNRQTA